jgi:hypothetical protein
VRIFRRDDGLVAIDLVPIVTNNPACGQTPVLRS